MKEGKIKPQLVSFCLFTYNQEEYIAKAVQGALDQSYSNLEIIISDDCSTDRTFEIIEKLTSEYDGPHKVIINRNHINMGLVPHFNEILNRATGEYIAVAAGDDISMPDRVEKKIKILLDNPNMMAVSSELQAIDKYGVNKTMESAYSHELKSFSVADYLANPSKHINAHRMYRRVIMETFGNIQDTCPTEDTTMLLRCFMKGSVGLVDTPLVQYRVHDESISFGENRYKLSFKKIYQQYITDINKALEKKIITENLSEKLFSFAEKYYKTKDIAYSVMKPNSIMGSASLLFRILKSSDFDLKQKKSLVKKLIRHFNNK